MTQIDPLTKLNKGESLKPAIINTNFEMLRLAHNDIVSRINAVIDKLKTLPEFNSNSLIQFLKIPAALQAGC